MEQSDYSTISKPLESDFLGFCKINNIQNIEEFRFECFKKGYYIEKYGLLGEDDEIAPWEVVVEKEVEKQVIVNADCSECNDKLTRISETLQSLRSEIDSKQKELIEKENKINELTTVIKSRLARFHPGSDLKKTL